MKVKFITFLLLFVAIGTYLYPQSITPTDTEYGLYGIWAKRAPFGSEGNAEIRSSVTDENGNVYLSGFFEGKLNFSDDLCNPVMSNVSSSLAKSLFLLKLDKYGKYLWHIVYEINEGISDPLQENIESLICDYEDGKLLLYGRFIFLGVMPAIGINITFFEEGSNNLPESYSKQTNSTRSDRYYFQFLHSIDVTDGSTKVFLDPFSSLTHNLTARYDEENIHVIHMGWDANLYTRNSSVISIYGPDGNNVSPDKSYPDQPFATPDSLGCGSTIMNHVTLADGRQVMIHNSFGKNGDIENIPLHYLLYYSPDYDARDTIFLISERSIQVGPQLTTDNSSNIYLATNYGWSVYWDTRDTIPNSNRLDNFLGSGEDFITQTQSNKVVLARMNPDYSVKWIFQIGRNADNDGRLVVANDMKTVGGYTYIVGQFMGNSIDFNGERPGFDQVLLSNAGNSNPQWHWNWDTFYAVYDNETGNCVYAVNMGDLGAEYGATLSLSSDATQVLIGGTYTSRIFQPDLSRRLYPISSNELNDYGFIAKYSTDINSTPSKYTSSFGDAPESYGVAVHHIYSCVDMGYATDLSLVQDSPDFSADANTAQNDNGIDIGNIRIDGFINLNHTDFKLDESGDLKVNVIVNNTAPGGDEAKLIGWIDFNQNGVFDGADEASSTEIIASGTTGGIKTLTWTGARNKLRNGTTYLRLRFTTDLMDDTQPQGLFFNGEVEDYRLDFDLARLEKTALSSSTDPTGAYIGDTITYTLNISNKIKGDILLYDPIPEGTNYLDSYPAGFLTEMSINGNNEQAITWNVPDQDISDNTFSFRVIITHKPENSTSIINTAYAKVFADTISSSHNGNLAEIVLSKIKLNNDNIYMCDGSSVEFDILANDYILQGFSVTPDISGFPSMGTVYVNDQKKIVYTSNSGFSGLDEFRYIASIDGQVSEAAVKVNISGTPQLYALTDLFLCLGEHSNVVPINSTIAGSTYDWTGGSLSGLEDGRSTDNIPSFTALAASSIVSVTPKYDYYGLVCTGETKTFEINVKTPVTGAINQDEYLWTGAALNGNSWNSPENWMVYDGSNYNKVTTAPQINTDVRIMKYENCVDKAVIISDPNSICNNLTISGANLIMNGSNLEVYGSWTNDGIFTPDGHTVITFAGNGRSERSIKTGNSFFTNINFNLEGNIKLLDTLVISERGEFSNGIIYGNAVFMESSNSIIPQGSQSFINGEVKKYGAGQFVFPLGDVNIRTLHPSHPGIEYTVTGRLGVMPAHSSVTPEITATYYYDNQGMPDWWHNSTNLEEGLHHVSDREHWKITSNEDIEYLSIHWQDNHYCTSNNLAEVCTHGFCPSSNIGYADLNTLSIVVSDGGKWRMLNTQNSGDHDNGYLQSYEIVSLNNQSKRSIPQSFFVTFGSTDESVPLPIELLEFKAIPLEKSVDLIWSTATETNNDYFDIEKSTDAVNFEKIGQVQGSGSSNTILYYDYEDIDIRSGIVYYYRLKQVDYDNTFSYSPIKSAVLDKQNPDIYLFPNPAYEYIGLIMDINEFDFEIINHAGQIVFNGNNTKTINVSNLSPGLYILKIWVGNDMNYERFIKQ